MPGGIHPPLEVILAWPKPNLVNPEIRPKTILYLTCILGPISVAVCLARLWVRIIHQRNSGWDDWLIAVAMIPFIALTVLFPLVDNGFDRHVWDADIFGNPEKVLRSRKYVLAIDTTFCTMSGLVKVSILLFYRRLGAKAVSTTFRCVTWATIIAIIAFSIALTLAPLLGCQPFSAWWDQVDSRKLLKGDYEYHCFNEAADTLSASVISTTQDLITAVLPTFLYWNIQIPIRQKVALFGIFAIGYGVTALGAIRSYYSWYVFYRTYDSTWATWDMFLVSLLEMHLGAFCANAPALKVFFRHFFHGKLASRFNSPAVTKNRNDSGHTDSKFSTSRTVFRRMSAFFTRGTSSRSRDGYLSESSGGVVVDHLGGVKVEKEIKITRSPLSSVDRAAASRQLDTIDVLYDRYYEDIEMGRFDSTENSPVPSMRSLQNTDEEVSGELPPKPLARPGSGALMTCPPSTPVKDDVSQFPAAGPSRGGVQSSAASVTFSSLQTLNTTNPPRQTRT